MHNERKMRQSATQLIISNNRAKIIALCLSLSTIVLYASHVGTSAFALDASDGCLLGGTLLQRVTFHFFHANVIHLVMNIYCLLCLAFLFELSLTRMFLAYLIAASYPTVLFPPDLPIIGLSGCIYAAIGLIFFNYDLRMLVLVSLGMYSCFGLLFGNFAVGLHLYCFFAGFLVSLITSDIFD